MCESHCLKADRKGLLGHHSQIRRGCGALVGRGGSSEQRKPALPFLYFFFSIKILYFWKEPPEREKIAALCMSF